MYAFWAGVRHAARCPNSRDVARFVAHTCFIVAES
jgi:hypothetical protein